jgi:hypothetical protein
MKVRLHFRKLSKRNMFILKSTKSKNAETGSSLLYYTKTMELKKSHGLNLTTSPSSMLPYAVLSSSHLAILFKQMLVVIMVSDKCFRLVDIGHRGLERSRTVGRKGALSPPWDFFPRVSTVI